MDYVTLGVLTVASAVGIGLVAYIKMLKKRIKRYVLRYEKIEKYFKEDKP